MRQLIDLETWNRKDHFNFFNQFEEPYFGICVEIDCTLAYAKAKALNSSFFLYYLHKILIAVNRIESFRYRISDGQVYVYDKINASPPIDRPDGTFGYAYIDYDEDFSKFSREAVIIVDQVRNSKGLFPSNSGDNVIHFSAVPWINFTSISHPRRFSFKDSCPKLAVGKITTNGEKKTFPLSVHVHHALMDAYQVGLFVDEFQRVMNE
jgi:chloramphenicol O-acetyltransferase type A